MEEYTLKFIAIGDYSVGKTSIMNAFVDGEFCQYVTPTLGIECKWKKWVIDGQSYVIQVWDIGGQEKYRIFTGSVYRRVHGILLVFDLNKKLTFEHIRSWMQQIQENADKDVAIAMIGNKSDLSHEVSIQEAKSLAHEFDIPYYSVSAKNRENIDNVFEYLAIAYLDKNPQWPPKGLRLNTNTEETPNSCCN